FLHERGSDEDTCQVNNSRAVEKEDIELRGRIKDRARKASRKAGQMKMTLYKAGLHRPRLMLFADLLGRVWLHS
ncbi:hypothetical protein AKJ16_DCAP04403, partial [Drosera capensis]